MKVCLLGDARSVHMVRLSTALSRVVESVRVVSHKEARIPGVAVERFSVPPPGLTNLHRWRGRRDRYLLGFLREFDVVNVQFLHDWYLTPAMIGEGCVVSTPWGSDIVHPPGERSPDQSLAGHRKMLLRESAGVTALGRQFAGVVADFADLETWRVSVVPWGVDLSSFDRGCFLPARAGDPLRIGFFKGFRRVYGASILIRAMALVLRRHPKVGLEMIGDGPEKDECQHLACELGIADSIRWSSVRRHWELPGLMAGWRFTVIPSLQESFGMAALEASAMRLPVIASNVGGLGDSVRHSETGLLVPPGDPEALATAMMELIESPALCRRLGHAGRSFVESNYERHMCLQRQLDTYRICLDRSCALV